MALRQDLKTSPFVITAEINPPKSVNPEHALINASKLKGLVSAINITDNSGAAMKMCPLVLSYLVQSQTGIEAIWQMTCRDRNRLALQSDLLGASALGLINLLPLKGDAPHLPLEEAKCFDFNTDTLLEAIQALKKGHDYEGNALKDSAPDFCVGSAAHPNLPNLSAQKSTMLKRLDLGVEFFQTQICFEIDQINRFVDSIGEELASRTLLGITPLKTLKQAEFMNANVFGVTVPEQILEQLSQSSDASQTGLEIARELIQYIQTQTPLKGVHIMAIGQEDKLQEIIKFCVAS